MIRLETDVVIADRYKLIELKGKGGFAEVWKVYDKEADNYEALKIYAPGLGIDTNIIEHFRNDFKRTRQLRHTYLLTATYFGIYQGSPYLIMPLCEKGSLEHELKRRLLFNTEEKNLLHSRGMNDEEIDNKLIDKTDLQDLEIKQNLIDRNILSKEEIDEWQEKSSFSEREIAKVLWQISEALNFLHSQHPVVLHRDIKTANVLIDNSDNYVVTDFGISTRVRNTLRKATSTSESLSFAYAPPERFSSHPENLPEGDVFSLGVMLYELCTTEVPWEGNGGIALNMGATIPNLPERYTKRLDTIVKACLSPDPANRPQAVQLATIAKSYLENEYWEELSDKKQHSYSSGSHNNRKTEKYSNQNEQRDPQIPLPKNKSKKKSPWLVIASILVIIAGVGIYLFLENKRIEEQYNLSILKANTHLQNALYDSSLLYFEKALSFKKEDNIALAGVQTLNYLIEGLKYFYSANYEKAYLSFEKAAALENGDAYYYLGELAYNGLGTKKDDETGLEYTNKALEQGFEMAYWRLGTNAIQGIGGDIDSTKAGEYFLKAIGPVKRLAELGDPEAQGNLGSMYDSGSGVTKNEQLALKWWLQSADQDYAFIQANVGGTYHSQEKFHEAYNWFNRAAALGEPRAWYYLGLMYFNGDSVSKNWNTAKEWFEKSSAHDYALANFYLGLMYYRGDTGFDKNYAKAVSWFDKSDVSAGYRLIGDMYIDGGHQLTKDYKKAESYYLKALEAENENISAKSGLAYLYQNGGNGLSKNTSKAIELHKELSKIGVSESSYQLALIFWKDDNKAAIAWLETAIKQGSQNAVDFAKYYIALTSFYTYKNDFKTEDKRFYSHSNINQKREVKNGKLTISGYSEDYIYQSFSKFNEIDPNKDFTVSVSIRWVKNEDKKEKSFGVHIGGDDEGENYYRLAITSSGYLNFYAVKNDTYQDISKWMSNKANAGRSLNTLKLTKEKNYFKVNINDELVGEYYHSRVFGNNFGIFVNGKQQVEFDDFSLIGTKK